MEQKNFRNSRMEERVERYAKLQLENAKTIPVSESLDSSLKNYQKFVRKIKTGVSAVNLPALKGELVKLKLEKYLVQI